jgi:hypothetical protein
MHNDTEPNSERKHPANADILLAARDDSSRYHFVKRGRSGVTSVPATNSCLAQELAADEFPSLSVEDFHEISEEEDRMIRRWRRQASREEENG